MATALSKRGRAKARKSTGFAAGYRRAVGISERSHLAGDPVAWVKLVLKEYMWSKQREILESVRDHRYTAVQSCHGIGKSYTASRSGLQWADTRPDPFLVTTAPTWKQVNAILWREIRKGFNKSELEGRINLDAEWYINNDELIGFGRKPADYDATAFQGIHALNVHVIIDEACGVPKMIFDAVDSLATNERARVLAIGNPDDPASHFAEICKPGSGWNVIKVSAFDTPAFTGEPVPDVLLDLLISEKWVEERKKRWGEQSPIYQSKVLGEFPEISDDMLLSPKLILDAQMRTVEIAEGDRGKLGLDVARFGDDKTACYLAMNGRVRLVKAWEKLDTMETANRAAGILRGAPKGIRMAVDIIGVGGGVFDRLRELNLSVEPFNSSERPFDTERFHNRRAEAYWHVRDLAERGLLDLPSPGEDDDLIAQLGGIKWKQMPGGKIVMESKEDMKKRGMPSPDRADAAIMALADGPLIQRFDFSEPETQEYTSGLRDRPM